MKSPKKTIQRRKKIVVPPGGPRAIEKVHGVSPGHVIRRDDKGSHSIILKSGSGKIIQAPTEELVFTPGGHRPKSYVHKVEAGHILRVSGSRLKKLDQSRKIVADFGAVAPGLGQPPAPAGGWVAYGYWNNNTGIPISLFKTTWTVPLAPATQSGQLIYLFNGIQNSTNILQPVLQWGASPAGGGNYWAIANWYVGPPGAQAFYSELVQVNPGDVLTGVMTLTGQAQNHFNYRSEFQGIAGPTLPVENIEQLAWCCETLESYGITAATDYPATQRTQLSSITIQTGATVPAVTWTPAGDNATYGENCTVPINSATNGEVDIFYQA